MTVATALRRTGAVSTSTWHTLFPWTYSWLADDLSAGSVSSWASGTGSATLTTTSAPVQAATTGPNSQPGVTFDGINQFLQTSFTAIAQPDTVVVIGRYVVAGAGATTRRLFDSASAANRQTFTIDTAGTRTAFAGTTATGAAENTSAHVWTCYFNGASSVIEIDNASAIAANLGAQTLAGLTLGARYDAAATFGNVVVAAVGVYGSGDARAASEWDSALAPYVSTKWGITL